MADMHELIVTSIIFLYQRSIHPLKKDALLLILHNFLLYYVINMFKHLAQDTINSDGPVNTFYYVPLVFEESVALGSHQSWHEVLRSSSWQFFEVLFRHHLALLLPFNLALLVPRCKLAFISTLVLLSNFVMFVCFSSAICQLVLAHSHAPSLRLLTILGLGPVCQALLACRLLARMWLSEWIVV
ncbi:uncharacterized protein [Drosophila takahashii]|uniref:uncharacterized protein isoform X2 n=1 Tax=Drosophila takahashii TaxID=29030 RepID=UPI001CF8B369|nr:uncharacterized protein LOC108064226 isoform X2 [Drosophila takahashii]